MKQMYSQQQRRHDNSKGEQQHQMPPQQLQHVQRGQLQRPQSKGLLNRTTQDASSSSRQAPLIQPQTSKPQDRSFNGPVAMRHKSPNQMTFIHGAPLQPMAAQTRPQNRSRGPPAQHSASNNSGTQQKSQQRQYQPSLVYKPGLARQQFEHINTHGRSEPEIHGVNNYQTHPVPQSQQNLNVAAQAGYQNQQNMAAFQKQQVVGGRYPQSGTPGSQTYQPQFISNQSFQRAATDEGFHTQPQPMQAFEGPVQRDGAENQNPFPRQFPYESQKRQQVQQLQTRQVQQQQVKMGTNPLKQPFTSPDSLSQKQGRVLAPDAMKRSPPQGQRQQHPQANNVVQQNRKPAQAAKIGPTHQMRAYDTAPQVYRDVFYPQNDQIQAQQQIAEEDGAVVTRPGRYDLPRSLPRSDSAEDDQIREMENLLAEIGQDVSELKKRPFYQRNLQFSEPRSSKRLANKIQGSKSNSLSPKVNNNRSRSYNSNSNEGQQLPVSDLVHHRNLSPQLVGNTSSNGAGPRKQVSSQSRKHTSPLAQTLAHNKRQSLQQQPPSAPPGASDSDQWNSPSQEHKRISSQLVQNQAAQNNQPTPSHTNTMSLTVSVNPADQNQERLFRLSPLSSKMQEDTDGEEQSNSQRAFFNLNQSINNSQLDSSSPGHQHQAQQIHRQSAEQLASSESEMIMQELATRGRAGNRTFEDDDEEVANAIPEASNIEEPSLGGMSPLRQLAQQPYSEAQPVLRSSALHGAPRAETPLAASEIRENDRSTSRAFSRSSKRRGQSHNEGPRATMKIAQCQTDLELFEATVSRVKFEKKAETVDGETQTHRRDFAPVQLSPFDTYDLFFVKDLVNNLNQDNEVLVDTNQDLKYAFHFLLQKHKQLQQQLTREQAKNSLFEDTQKRLKEVTAERDQALEHGMQLSNKVLTMNKVIRLAIDEQAHLEQESETIQYQLEEENKMLRSLMKISEDHSSPTTQAVLQSTVQEIEKKQAEMAYKADMQLREQAKAECEQEFDVLKKELPEKIEKEMQVKFDEQTKELESMYEEKLQKQEEETALLKKTLLEQSLQRLQSIQSQNINNQDGNSEESNSLEGSHGLQNFSRGSSDKNQKQPNQEQLQMSNSLSSSQNDSSIVMQQELDAFTQNVYGDLTQEEQDLVSQLTAQAASQNPTPASSDYQDGSGLQDSPERQEDQQRRATMQEQQTKRGSQQVQEDDDGQHVVEANNDYEQMGANTFKRKETGYPLEEEEEDDDYVDDFETFGEEVSSPTELAEENKLIQVITNPKQPTSSEAAGDTKQDERVWDFDKGFSEDLFNDPEAREAQLYESEQNMFSDNQLDGSDGVQDNELMEEDFLTESGGSNMTAKMTDSKISRNEMATQQQKQALNNNNDLLADFGDDQMGNHGQDGENEEEKTDMNNPPRDEILKQQYEDFFTSESDEIDEDIAADGESSDSDSDSGIQPGSFDELYDAQNKQNQAPISDQKDLENMLERGQDQDDPNPGFYLPSSKDSMAPTTSSPGTSSLQQTYENQSSSERRNKYKRDKRASGGHANSDDISPEESKGQMVSDGAKTIEQTYNSLSQFEQNDSEALEFNPPQEAATSTIAQDFDDFLYSAETEGQETANDQAAVSGKDGNNAIFDFYDDWEEDGDDLFGNRYDAIQPKKNEQGADGMDEEDRRFFEELSKGFTAKEGIDAEPLNDQPMERNELMDDTRATRQMLQAQRESNSQPKEMGAENLGSIDFEAEREESKEDEYDYFLDNQADENSGNAQGYHIIDEGDLQDDSEEDLEELDEDEKAQRHREMLKEFKERMEKEDARASRSPRHRPR